MTIYTDGSVRGTRGGWAFVGPVKRGSGFIATRDALVAEIHAVNAALAAHGEPVVVIVTDNSDVQAGIAGRRYQPAFVATPLAPLWEEFDRLAAGREVRAEIPEKKNTGLHGLADTMSRRARK